MLGKYFPAVLLSFCFLSITSNSALAAPDTDKAKAEVKPNIGRMGDSVVVDAENFEFSDAERTLWLKDHLKNVRKPARLYYEFVKSGTYEEGFSDAVYLDILEINDDGSKNALLEFFTADRQQAANQDNLSNITGNPIIGIYMQGDVVEMNRLTEGHWRYFHKRIKIAISESARIDPVSFDFDGKKVTGEKITITPYVNDPRRKQFDQFADKRYEFIFSNQVPGSLYQIKTIIPDNSGDNKKALIEEILTLKNVSFSS